jgi:hypothetical protein
MAKAKKEKETAETATETEEEAIEGANKEEEKEKEGVKAKEGSKDTEGVKKTGADEEVVTVGVVAADAVGSVAARVGKEEGGRVGAGVRGGGGVVTGVRAGVGAAGVGVEAEAVSEPATARGSLLGSLQSIARKAKAKGGEGTATA